MMVVVWYDDEKYRVQRRSSVRVSDHRNETTDWRAERLEHCEKSSQQKSWAGNCCLVWYRKNLATIIGKNIRLHVS